MAEMKNKTVRLTDEQIKKAKQAAKEDRRDFSEIVRIALDDFLEQPRFSGKRKSKSLASA